MLKMLDLQCAIIQSYNIKNTNTESQCTRHIFTVIGGLLQCVKTLVIHSSNQNIEMLTDGGVNGHIYWFVLLSDQKIFERLYCNTISQGKQYCLSIYTYICIIWGSVKRED